MICFLDQPDETAKSTPPSTSDPAKKPTRSESLEEYEQLNRTLIVIARHGWWAIGAIIMLLTLTVFWAFFGSISIYVEGRGIVMNKEGVFVAQASANGILQNVTVEVGDLVKKGSVLGYVYNPELELQITTAEMDKTIAQKDYNRLKKLIEGENKSRLYALRSQLKSDESALKELKDQLPEYQAAYDAKKKINAKGLERLSSILEAEEALVQKQIEIENLEAKIANSKAEISKGYRTEELQAKEQQLLQASENLEKLEVEKQYSVIQSPADGVVLSLLRQEGTYVQAGTSTVWLEHSLNQKNAYLFYAYVSIELGKKINPGDNVNIEITTANPHEYGYIEGVVTEVSPYVISPDDLVNTIHNTGLVQYLMAGQTGLIQVSITPKKDPSTPTGYKWTSGKGPDIFISTGTICKMSATVERIRPIYYAFPIWSFTQLHYHKND